MAIKIFVDGNSTLTVADNNVSVVGAAAGSETVKILAGVTGTTLDSNIEKIELSDTLANSKMVYIAGTGTQIQNAAGVVVATIPSLNQASKVAFTDGSAPLVQTATGFTLGNAVVGTTAAAITTAAIGTTFDTTVKSTVTTTTTTPVVATLPTLSVAAVALAEGNTGTANMAFTVTLSAASTSAVTVAYATTAGTATSGVDFTATSGTLTIAANALTGTINVPVLGDAIFEANETFTLTLSNPTNATVSTTAGVVTGTITNDDTNASPAIVLPTAATSAFIGSTTAVTGISFTDADDNAGFSVTLQAAGSSQLSLSSLTATSGNIVTAVNAAGTSVLAGVSSNLLTLSGSKADLNSVLGGLRYSTNSTIPTTESITLTVTDPNSAKTTSTLTVNIGNSLALTSATTDNLVGSAGDDLFTGTLANLVSTDTISGGAGTDKLTLTAVNGTVLGQISAVEVLDLALTGTSTVTVSATNFGASLMTVNTSGVQTLQGTFNTGTTFNFDAAATTALTVTDLLVASTSVSVGSVLTDIVTLNFNGSSTAASVLTTLTAAPTIDTLNIVSTGSSTTANSIGAFGALASPATVNVSGAQAFTATLPNLGTGTFNGANATGKLTITASNNATTVVGGSAADVITGGSAASSLTGGAGNDTIVGGTVADTITGGLGADSMTGGITGLNTFVFAAGDSLSTGRDTLVDLKEGDIIKFGTALTGLTHAATLSTSSASAIHVDATNNRLVVGNDQITIPASVANAAYTYSSGTDAIVGTIDDTITVGAAPFNASNNGLGKLTLTGKSASTVAVVINAATPSTVNNSSTLNTTNLSSVNTLDASGLTTSGVTVTHVAAAADTITGSSQADTIAYLLTADLFTSNASVDSIVGGLGTDIISVGTSGTGFTIASGDAWTRISGVETLTAVTNTAALSITLAATAQTAGITTVNISAGNTSNSNVVDVSAYTTVGVTIVGAAGSNTLTGGTAGDTITGGAASDTIVGGAGADSLVGGAGSDVITGGTGADDITGGNNNDTVILVAADTSAVTGTNLVAAGTLGATEAFTWTTAGGYDKITGFANGDTVQLYTTGTTAITTVTTAIVAGGTVSAANAGFVGAIVGTQTSSSVFTAATGGADTLLVWDADGTGTGTAFSAIVLVGYTAVTSDTISNAGLFTAA